MYRKLLLSLLTIATCRMAVAQHFSLDPNLKLQRVNSSVIASSGTTYPYAMPAVEDILYSSLTGPTPSNGYFKSTSDYVAVGVRNDTAVITTAYKYRVSLSLSCKVYPGGTTTSKSVVLEFSYDPDSLKPYTDRYVHKFSGYHSVVASVTNVEDISGTTPVSVPRNNLPRNFYVEAGISMDRYDNPGSIPVYAVSYLTNNNNSLYLKWGTSMTLTNVIQPMEYELEWAYVDDYRYDISTHSGSHYFQSGSFNGNIPYDFRKNSTRIRLKKNEYYIPLVYEGGAVVFRIRTVRPDYGKTYKDAIYGAWSAPDAGTFASNDVGHAYLIPAPHMGDKLNWQYTISFAEEGKYKHVINYFDGSLRGRQTQTKINTDSAYVIGVDKAYDYEGRPSIQTLPSPFQQAYLGYRDDIVRVGSSRPYLQSDYDQIGCNLPDSIPPLLNSSLAGKYYSSANTDMAGAQKFVPDAKGYPIIQSIHSPDNKLIWQGGAGYDHQLWTKHGTRYEYTQATEGELDFYFKNEAGVASYFPKKVTTDPNLQSSFAIHNPAGKPVITGLIGYPDTLNSPIEMINGTNNNDYCFDILHGVQQKITADEISINKKFYVELNGPHSIQYKAKIPAYNLGCNIHVLARAAYDFSATDECGIARISKTTGILGYDSVVTTLPAGFDYYSSPVTSASLIKGNHSVDKRLLFNRNEVNSRVRQGVLALEQANCSPNENSFIRSSVENASLPCGNSVVQDSCAGKKYKMMQELYPDAKYGMYAKTANGSFFMDTVCYDSSGVWLTRPRIPMAINQNSIFTSQQICNTTNPPCVSSFLSNNVLLPSCLRFRYQDDCITMPTSVVKDGRTYTNIKSLPVDTFIYVFNDEIAMALLPLHPEYCKLAFCDDGRYIEELNSFQTQKQAVQGNRFLLDSIIANDPLYYKASSSNKPQIKDKLAHMKNATEKRIDRIALEQAYCAAGNGQEVQHNAKFLYFNEIANNTFVDSTVKQQYFDALKSLYLGNRSYILQKALDSTAATCSPCTTARMTLIEPAIFPRLFSNNSSDIASNIEMPSWLKTIFNNAMDPNYNSSGFNPPPTNITDSLINKVNDSLAQGNVDAIMRKLINCTLSQDTLTMIRNRLLYYIGQGSELTPLVVKTAITDVNVSVGDLCNSFLAAYNTDKGEEELPYDCGRPELYTGLKDFLSRSGVITAATSAAYAGGGVQTVYLSATNKYENEIAAKLSLTNLNDPVWVEGYLDTIQYSSTFFLKYVKLKITKPNTTNSIYLYFKRKSTNAPYMDGATSLTVNAVTCLNDDDGMHNGYAAKYTAVADYYMNGNTTVARRYYVWSKDIPVMVPSPGKMPLACLHCIDIKNAVKSYKADKGVYNYDDADNHPFFDITLTNYLNYHLKKNYTYDEYINLMRGCAVSDSVEIPHHLGFIRYQMTNNDVLADTLVDRVGRYTTRSLIDLRFKYAATAVTHIALDFSVVPFDSVLRYRNDLITMGIYAGASVHYLPTDAMRVFRNTACSPSPHITTYGSFSKDLAVVYNGKAVHSTDSIFTYTGTYASPLAHADMIAASNNYIGTCSNSSVWQDAALFRTADYITTGKQNYLSYVYGLEGKSRIDIRDSLETYNLKSRLSGFSSKALRYDDPSCGDNMRDLYVCTSTQSTHPGTVRMNLILGQVNSALGSSKLFLTANSNTQAYGANLKIYRKANNVHWYRYFDGSNNLYNLYLEPPANAPFDINTLVLDSVRIGPGTDSLYRFTAYMRYGSMSEVIACRGYANFPLGYGQRIQDVVLYNKPGSQNCLDSVDCEYNILQEAIWAGKARYAFYFDSSVVSHSNKMYRHILDNTKDTLILCAKNSKNMITLYYYDLNGNLQRTVPPQGVDGSGNAAHTKVTYYNYDSRNLLRKQQTPDAGITNFFYDAAGRMAFSQNDKQKPQGKFSYTLYDELSRPRETGEVVLTDPNAAPPAYVTYSYNDENYPSDTLTKYIKTRTRYDVVVTTYDTMKTNLGNISGEHLSTQENLYSRVSTVTYYLSKAADYNNTSDPTPHFVTYYSYDAVGNVKTVSYNSPAMQQAKQQYKRVDYDYDQISGKVNMISYNRGRPDQFYQRYDYDADNRITLAETSNDGLIWNRDASYVYYKHGPLANVKVGNNQIQSLDYAYTIQGWLKEMNGDVLRTDKQMMPDGAVGDLTYARDAVAHTIDYFKDDYRSIDNTAKGLNLTSPDRGMYNGNIARTTTAIRGVSNSGGANDNMRASYVYDQAQRLVKTAYESINEPNLTAAATGKFANHYQYDMDGNLKWLTRYSGATAPAKIDSIQYNYATGNNRLTFADDKVNNVTGGVDFQKGQVAGNYSYDAIGNLLQDNQANLKMEWNLYGKLRSVDFLNSTPKRKLWYEYDGQGNRVRKAMVTSLTGGSEDHRGEYYVRDASGNILATYKFNTIFAKISLIAEANSGVHTHTHFPKFVNAVAATGSYVKGFADLAVDVSGGWVDVQTDKPASFYFNNSPALYSNILTGTTAADYLNDLQVYDGNAPSPQLYTNALMAAPTEAANIVDEVLTQTTEGKKLLEHFDAEIPSPDLDQMWTNLGVDATRTMVHSQNANTLYNWMKQNSQESAVLGALQTMLTAPEFDAPTRAFYHAIMQDDVIYESTNLRSAASTFTVQLQNLVHGSASQPQVLDFLDGWTPTATWMTNNTTLSDRMQVVYRADADAVLGDWIANATDVLMLDTLLANTEDLIAFDYHNARLTNSWSNDVGLPPMDVVNIYTFGPVVDTTNLSEHHIYGSSRLGVQTYKDSIYRQTYNNNTTITPLKGLSRKAVWYENRYNDLIDSTQKEPYGNSYTGDLALSRLLSYRHYELTDHLGNVLSTVLDRKTGHNPGGSATSYDYYLPDVSSAQGYYPFGQRMKEWHNEVADTVYKMSYNGQRRDDDIKGAFNHNTALFGELDPRLAIRWNLDPKPNPSISPYLMFGGNPIWNNDVLLDSPRALTTHLLRDKARAAGATGGGINFNRQAGKMFEGVSLRSQGLSENTKRYTSSERKAKTYGKSSEVIPDGVRGINETKIETWCGIPYGTSTMTYPESSFFEVKAVDGVIGLSYNRYQIQGELDAVSQSMGAKQAGRGTMTFITTANTFIAPDVINYANKKQIQLYQVLSFEETDDGSIRFTPPIPLNNPRVGRATPINVTPAIKVFDLGKPYHLSPNVRTESIDTQDPEIVE